MQEEGHSLRMEPVPTGQSEASTDREEEVRQRSSKVWGMAFSRSWIHPGASRLPKPLSLLGATGETAQ